MQISFDVHSLGVVLDLAEEKALGTGFALLPYVDSDSEACRPYRRHSSD